MNLFVPYCCTSIFIFDQENEGEGHGVLLRLAGGGLPVRE